MKTASAALLTALAARVFGSKQTFVSHQPSTDLHDVTLHKPEIPSASEVQLHEVLLLRALM